MKIKIGINGMGRIGRMIIRSIVENNNKNLEIKHINNRTNSEVCSALLKYDSIHGKFEADVSFEDKKLIHSIEDGTGSVKYALCEEGCECKPQDQHIHFHCIKCGETYCLTQSKIPQTSIPSGFKAASASMVYKGTCANCT